MPNNSNIVVSEREMSLIYLHRRLDDREAQVSALRAEVERLQLELLRLKPHVPEEVLKGFEEVKP